MVLRGCWQCARCAAVTVGLAGRRPAGWGHPAAVVAVAADRSRGWPVAWLLMACLSAVAREGLRPAWPGAVPGGWLWRAWWLFAARALVGLWPCLASAWRLLASALVAPGWRARPAPAARRHGWLSCSRASGPTFVQHAQQRHCPGALFEPAKAEACWKTERPVSARRWWTRRAGDSGAGVDRWRGATWPSSRMRFGERLRLSNGGWTAADGAQLPPLLLQPLVENAVRHGVEPSTEGAEVHIQHPTSRQLSGHQGQQTPPGRTWRPARAGAGQRARAVIVVARCAGPVAQPVQRMASSWFRIEVA